METILDKIVSVDYIGNVKNDNSFHGKNKMYDQESLEEKEKILAAAKEIYTRHGFYKTSMDDVAKELGMSKKTIYKHFESKDVLVENVVELIMQNIGKNVDKILKSDSNALEKIIGHVELMSNTVFRYSDKWLSDIRMYAPHLWTKIDEFRTKKMINNLSKIINQAKKEGLFTDYPTEVVVAIFISAVRSIVNPEFLFNSNYSFKKAIETTFDILLNGLLSNEGKKNYKKLSRKYNEDH